MSPEGCTVCESTVFTSIGVWTMGKCLLVLCLKSCVRTSSAAFIGGTLALTYWKSALTSVSLIVASSVSVVAAAQETSEQVILEADDIYENAEDNTVIAEGSVEALYEGRVLRADRVIYNRNTEKVRAIGNVVIIDTDGTQQFSDEAEVNADLTDGYAVGFSARLGDGATVVANSAIRQSDGINALDQVVFSSCEVCEEKQTPTWALRARRAVLDQETQMISYRDAVVEVAGFPVLYLPYLAHPDPSSGRRSGLLIPSAGLSSKLGGGYQQPYHWVISDSSDLTIAPLVTTNVNPLLEFDYRKRFFSGDIELNTSFTYESDFDSDGERIAGSDESWRSHILGRGRFAITPNWQWGFGVERQSDDLYDRRYDISGLSQLRGLYEAQPRRMLSQLFVVGQDENFYADASLLSFQGLRVNDSNDAIPLVAPLGFAEKYWDLGNRGFASVNLSTASLLRDDGADSQRLSLGAEWTDLNILPGGFTLETFADARADYYALDEDVSGKDNVARAVGNVGATFAYPLVRPGKSFDIIIEPKVMAAWGVSDANDSAIPLEDVEFYEFDEGELFEANGLSNYDLYEGDGKVAAGISTRAVWKNGTQIGATLGRRWRSESDPLFDVQSNLDGTSSDWIATASLDIGNVLRFNTRARLDDDGMALNRIDVRASTQLNRVRAVAQYFQIDESISPTGRADEGIFARAELKVTDNYYLIGGILHDITDDRTANSELGFAYADDCSRFELVYSRSELIDRTQGSSENLKFRFTLKGIGDFGSSDFD